MGIVRADVVCPFYSYDDGANKVVCEGLTKCSTLAQTFERKRQRVAYMEKYCFQECTSCEIFKMLIQAKYSDA